MVQPDSYGFRILCCLLLAGLLLHPVSAQLVREANTTITLSGTESEPDPGIDGTLTGDDAAYGPAKAIQDTQTGFGDNNDGSAASANGSELDGAYGAIGSGNLFLLFTGNLETAPNGFNKVVTFLDVGPGGQQRLLGDTEAGDFNRMGDSNGNGTAGDGLTFEAGFDADFALVVNADTNGTVFVDLFDLGAGDKFFLGTFPAGGSGELGQGVRAALDNANTAGVSVGSGPDDGSGVETGIELRLPLGSIGNPTGSVDVTAFIVNPSYDFVSNQFLPGIGGGANLGEPRSVDLGALSGVQFFTVPAGTGSGLAYDTEDAFPGLTFIDPVAIVCPPGETNRLWIVERAGRIQVITNLAQPDVTTFLDIRDRVTGGNAGDDERGLLGMAFHPNYVSNRHFYLFFTGNDVTSQGNGLHDILARYDVDAGNIHTASPLSEQVLFKQFDEEGNHNGGDLHFGPDGYLYISLGDEGGGNDSRNNTQLIDRDFFSAIARIDVDQAPGSIAPNPHPAIDGAVTHYAIPPDNPYIGTTQFNGGAVNPGEVRTEFFAIGLRNPWRMSFDAVSGLLYCGDVGQSAREEIDIITKAGNYGWAFREGLIAGPKAAPPGVTNVIDPILDYSRGTGADEGTVVTGGVVYRGDRFPELVGRYLFADFASGNLWSLFYDGTNATAFTRLTGDTGIAAFGKDPRNGDILLADILEDRIKRLTRSSGGGVFPSLLSDVGLFADLKTLSPHAGIVPYDIQVPFWSDGAVKTRWFSVPDTSEFMSFRAESSWLFPTGTVWIKQFDLLLTNGSPESLRRLETRVLVKDEDNVFGLTYRWGLSKTNASLVPVGGLDEAIVVERNGATVTQVWRYPSRAECLACHTPGAGGALGFNTVQMNREFAHGVVTQNQVQALAEAGYFDDTVGPVHLLRRLPTLTNAAYSVESRARAYLQANCAQCHFPGGPGQGLWNARVFPKLSTAGIVDGALLNDLGNPANRVVTPGEPDHSMLLSRISSNGTLRMPPLASSVLDTQGIALVSAWINELAGYQAFDDWQIVHFNSTNAPDAQRGADPDADGAVNELEWLTGTDPTNVAVRDGYAIDVSRSAEQPVITFERMANRGFEVQATPDLASPDWQPLDVPGNRPFFSAQDAMDIVVDDDTNALRKFYRMRVFEP